MGDQTSREIGSIVFLCGHVDVGFGGGREVAAVCFPLRRFLCRHLRLIRPRGAAAEGERERRGGGELGFKS